MMKELLNKLIKSEDRIRSSIDEKGELVEVQQIYESCRDVLRSLIDETQRRFRSRQWSDNHQFEVVQKKLEKVTQSLMKTLRVQKRQRIRSAKLPSDEDISEDSLMQLAQAFIHELTNTNADVVNEDDGAVTGSCAVVDNTTSSRSNTTGLPSSVQEYKHRLEKHSKELYKNPPVMPPDHVVVLDVNTTNITPNPPQRDSKTKRLTFFMPYEEFESNKNKKNASAVIRSGAAVVVVADFHPNVTPEEVLLGGAFGGTYFRSIHSAVTNTHYNGTDVVQETMAPEWLTKYDAKSISTKLTSSTYRTAVNKFKVKCGGSLGMWESSGWISDIDPYGWFQWYCHFYRGRRSSDDARQISRWKALAGTKGRFKSQLCNKILQKASTMTTTTTSATSKQSKAAMSAAINDFSISPVVRQTLFHWGLDITEDVMDMHQKSQKR